MTVNTKKIIFYAIMWSGIISTFIAAYITRGESLMNLLFCQESQTYMDFFESIIYGRTPYDGNATYPPLAYVVLGIWGRFIPNVIRAAGGYAVRDTQAGLFLLGIFLSFGTVLFTFLIIGNHNYKVNNTEKFLFLCTILCSIPMLFLLERANIIFYVMLLIYIFIYGYKSTNIFTRHFAYICLALAAGIKIYPAILGILVLRQKKIKDVLWCLFYGLFFFFAPFILVGGFQSLPKFLSNLLYSLSLLGEELGFGYKVNLSNTFSWLEYALNLPTNLNIVWKTIEILIIILGVIVSFAGKFNSGWKEWMIPLCFMIILPGYSFIYTLILLIIPLMDFLHGKSQRFDWFYALLFSLLFTPMIIIRSSFFEELQASYYQLNFSTMVESISLLIILLSIIIEGIISIFSNHKHIKLQLKNKKPTFRLFKKSTKEYNEN